MKNDTPKAGRPGETSQWPRWEGPPESRPHGYLPGEANIFSDDPEGHGRSDADIEAAVNDALADADFLDPATISVSVEDGVATLEGSVAREDDYHQAQERCQSVDGVRGVINNLRVAGEAH